MNHPICGMFPVKKTTASPFFLAFKSCCLQPGSSPEGIHRGGVASASGLASCSGNGIPWLLWRLSSIWKAIEEVLGGCLRVDRGSIGRSKMAWKGHLAETRARVEAGPLAWWVWLAPSQPPKSESCVTGNKLLPP